MFNVDFTIKDVFVLSLVLFAIGWMASLFKENVRVKNEGKFPKQKHTVLSGHREYSSDKSALDMPPVGYTNEELMAESVNRANDDRALDEALRARLVAEKELRSKKESQSAE